MNAYTIGIDPGLSGALACLDPDGRPIEWLEMPIIQEGKQRAVNGAALARWLLNDLSQESRYTVIREHVTPMPHDGSIQGFRFGRSVGVIDGVIATIGWPLDLVTPQQWKRHYGLLKQDKDAARGKAQQLFPEVPLGRKKDIGLADALLIANYGRLKMQQVAA